MTNVFLNRHSFGSAIDILFFSVKVKKRGHIFKMPITCAASQSLTLNRTPAAAPRHPSRDSDLCTQTALNVEVSVYEHITGFKPWA